MLLPSRNLEISSLTEGFSFDVDALVCVVPIHVPLEESDCHRPIITQHQGTPRNGQSVPLKLSFILKCYDFLIVQYAVRYNI